MPQATHFFVPCAGADTAAACKHNVLVPMGRFFDEQALASALSEHGWILFCGAVDRTMTDIPLPEYVYLAFCPECGSARQTVNGFVESIEAQPHDGN